MTDEKTIILEKSDNIATLFYARPKHNVFNIDMMNLFCDTLEDLSCENQAMLYKGFLKTTMERLTTLQNSLQC